MLWKLKDLTNIFKHHFIGHYSPFTVLVWLGSGARAKQRAGQGWLPVLGRGVPLKRWYRLAHSLP